MIPVLLKTALSFAVPLVKQQSRDALAKRLFLELARVIAANTDNKLDDQLVGALEKVLNNKDSGLQRKPTGPRKKKLGGKKP